MRPYLAGILMALCFVSGAAAQEHLKLTNGDWPPYMSQSLPGAGIMSAIVMEAFDRKNIRVEYIFQDSWNRSYVMAKKGIYDGTIGWSPLPEREADFYFSDPVLSHGFEIFHLKTTRFNWHTLSDLVPFRMGLTIGYNYGPKLEAGLAEKRFDAYRAYTDLELLHHLINARTDLVILDKTVGYYLLKTHFDSPAQAKVTHHPKSLGRHPLSVLISRKIPPERGLRLIRAFNEGLAELKENGRYKAILSRYAP